MEPKVISFSVSASEPGVEARAADWLVQHERTVKVHLITFVYTSAASRWLFPDEFREDPRQEFLEWVKANSGKQKHLHVAIFYEEIGEVTKDQVDFGRRHSDAEAELIHADA